MLPSRGAVPVLSDEILLVLAAIVSFVVTYVGTSVGLVLGHLRLALLVAWLGPVVGAGSSLAVSSVGALIGALHHGREGRIEARLLLSLGAPSAAAAFVTASLAPRVDPRWIKGAIAAALVAAGGSMLHKQLQARSRARAVKAGEAAAPRSASAESAASVKVIGWRALSREAAMGAIFGAVSGLVGLLLGTLRLPILMRLAQSPRSAIGTNMAIGALTGATAGIAAVREGSVDLLAFAALAPVTTAAAWLGARATGRLDRGALEVRIALILIATGVWMGGRLIG